MLTVSDISIRLPDRILLDSISFNVNRRSCVGLIGPNGAGKSTLLAVIAGTRRPDSGSVAMLSGVRVGYLRQGVADRPGGSLRDLLDDHLDGLLASEALLDDALDQLGSDQREEALARYDSAALQFENLGGYERMTALEESMHAFAVGDLVFDRPLASLSGGEKTRASLAALIATDPDLLLLDEPTNHLDRPGVEWLEGFLRNRAGATIVVSHDRSLLDAVATSLLVIDEDSATVREFVGGYSSYAEARRHEQAELQATWSRQQEMIERVAGDIRQVAGKASNYESMSVNDYQRGRSRKIARTAVVRRRKLERFLDSEERVDRPERKWGMAISFGEAPESGKRLIEIHDGSIALGGVPFLSGISLTINAGDRLGFVGANGVGKTTLLAAIAGRMEFASGQIVRSPSTRIGWFTQEHEGVRLDRSPLDQARAVAEGTEGEVRAFLHQFLLGPQQVLRPAGELSYGERARLALALLAIGGANLLLLDEPMNHLDIPSREQLEEAIAAAPVAVVIVSHDRYSLERLDTTLVDVTAFRVK